MIDAGARTALRELEAKLRPFVSRRVRSEADVDDVVQDVFLRMHRGLGQLREEERFGPWVYRIARSAIADHRRAMARHRVVDPQGRDEIATDAEGDDPTVERELASSVATFIAVLPSAYREALTLTELEGLTQNEAAARLGLSLSGMKSRVQRGRAMLRASLEDCCHIALDVRGRVVECEPRENGRLREGCCDAPRGWG